MTNYSPRTFQKTTCDQYTLKLSTPIMKTYHPWQVFVRRLVHSFCGIFQCVIQEMGFFLMCIFGALKYQWMWLRAVYSSIAFVEDKVNILNSAPNVFGQAGIWEGALFVS